MISGDDEDDWRETRNLQIGDEIKLANGKWARVLEVSFKGAGQVYNFTVAGNHNYFVGDLRLLTHNMCDLSNPSRRNHILNGDATGGGHKFGSAGGGTKFPANWSDDKVMHEISDIATDPSLTWHQQTGRLGANYTRAGAPVRYKVEGVRDGVRIRVIIEPRGDGIITGFPF